MKASHPGSPPYRGTMDAQQPQTTRTRVLKAVAVVVIILVISALLDLLLQHQGATQSG
jgi:hypothetical protein